MSAPFRILTPLVAFLGSAQAAVIPHETVVSDVFEPRDETLVLAIDPEDPLGREHVFLTFDGLDGFDYEINFSDDVTNWSLSANRTAAEGSFSFKEPSPDGENRRFYQALPLLSNDPDAPSWGAEERLTADVGATMIDVDWPGAKDDGGVVAYALYLDGTHLATIDPAERDWTISGLDPNTIYELDLFALDAGGNVTQLPPTLFVRTGYPQEPPQNPPRGRAIYLSSGEFTLSRTDMAIPARELGFVFTRTYRSNFEKAGPLGYGWTANVFERLRERNNGDVVWLQGIGRKDTFTMQAGGDYLAPPGVFITLEKGGAGFRLIDADGTTRLFDLSGKILSITTRNGNTLVYNRTGGQLTSITDDMGRTTTFTYDANDRLGTIIDFTGREVQYTYDADGNLIAARSPLVTGTPNGNDFPSGKIERYNYDSANPDPDLAHNLV